MIKIFNKWETTGIQVVDPGLRNYINLNPLYVPKTTGKNTVVRFWRAKTSIVERLMTKLMVPGHKGKKHKISSAKSTGKGVKVYNIVFNTFNIIEAQLKKNPVEVLVKAIENAAPREEVTTIEYGGAKYAQAVECAPQRRVDLTLRYMTQGAYQKNYAKKGKIEQALADEIMKAYKEDQGSNAIAKKLELERQADASR
ncbi:30S ribosomal protein S7 [Candidatus Woesearchaeota archaeon]|nr:30S ribosomal protein S7 [Candidatus Woesearchaeota archaeon]